MCSFTPEQLRMRAFERAASVLKHFWDEQKNDVKQKARVSTRIFDHLISVDHIRIGKSIRGGGHREHLVPCVKLRDRAFEMFWTNKTEKDVAEMLERFLRVADIHPSEAHHIDYELKLKQKMPEGWNFETGSVMARLEACGIKLITVD